MMYDSAHPGCQVFVKIILKNGVAIWDLKNHSFLRSRGLLWQRSAKKGEGYFFTQRL